MQHTNDNTPRTQEDILRYLNKLVSGDRVSLASKALDSQADPFYELTWHQVLSAMVEQGFFEEQRGGLYRTDKQAGQFGFEFFIRDYSNARLEKLDLSLPEQLTDFLRTQLYLNVRLAHIVDLLPDLTSRVDELVKIFTDVFRPKISVIKQGIWEPDKADAEVGPGIERVIASIEFSGDADKQVCDRQGLTDKLRASVLDVYLKSEFIDARRRREDAQSDRERQELLREVSRLRRLFDT